MQNILQKLQASNKESSAYSSAEHIPSLFHPIKDPDACFIKRVTFRVLEKIPRLQCSVKVPYGVYVSDFSGYALSIISASLLITSLTWATI